MSTYAFIPSVETDIKVNLFATNSLVSSDPKPNISNQLRTSIVTQLESSFWLQGHYLFQEEVEKFFNISADTLKSMEKEINSVLERRDLPKFTVRSKTEKIAIKEARKSDLDPNFVVAVSLLCDTLDKRAKPVKLKAAGLTTKAWLALLNDKKNQEYWAERVRKTFGQAEETAKTSLVRNVEAGDLQSIKYYHEFSGLFKPNEETQLNLLKIVAYFMEILVKHVPTNVVEAVAGEFESKLLELTTGV